MPTAAEIMTREVVTVSPETPVRAAAELLAERRFGALPVVDATGKVVGLVTEEDLVSRVADTHLPRHITFLSGIIYLENPQHFLAEAQRVMALTAGEIMDAHFPTVSPDVRVNEVALLMLEEEIRRVLVLDGEGRLLGMITRADIVRMQTTDHRLPEEGAQ